MAAKPLSIPAATYANNPVKNSNIGLKLSLGLGNQSPSNSQNLQSDGATSLSLGYGVSQNVTLWLGAQGGVHYDKDFANRKSTIAGGEISLQYKLRPYQKLRPYGKVGIGGFARHDEFTDITLQGAGITWALGGEYRLARFLTVGAEFFWKDVDYKRSKVGDLGDFEDLDDPVHGNTNGFMMTLTIH